MTKKDLAEAVHRQTGLGKRESLEFVETFFFTIKEMLSEGRNVKIPGFGVFALRDKEARIGRNPKTGEAIEITPRRIVTFKVSELFRKDMT